MCAEPTSSPHILIVEDEPSIESLLVTILAKQDYWITSTVTDGAQAVEAWENGNYDVILMDIKMPNMDGIQATKKIREAEEKAGHKRTPIIAFTACVDKETCQECFDAGADEFLSKPTKMENLVQAVSKYISL